MTAARLTDLDPAQLNGHVPIAGNLAKRPVDTAKRGVIGGILVIAAIGLLVGAVTSLVRWLGLPEADGPGLVHAQRTQAMMTTIGLGVLGIAAAAAAWWIIAEHLRRIRRIHRLYRFAVGNGLEFVESQSGRHLDGPAFEVTGNTREHSPFVLGRVADGDFELGGYVVRHVSSSRDRDGGGRTTTDMLRTRFSYLSIDIGAPLPTVRLHSRRAPRLRRADGLPKQSADAALGRAFAVRGDGAGLERLADPRLREALLAHGDRHHVELHGTRVTLLTRAGAYADEAGLRALLAAGDEIAPAVRAAFA
ncbi:MAG: hypothetical protein GXX90_08440 [Microbacteriaceae bacterium]|nr:hypothetical protein [Microbacteriaceae bacterium]